MEPLVCLGCMQSYHTNCVEANTDSAALDCPFCGSRLHSIGSVAFHLIAEATQEYPEDGIFNLFRAMQRTGPGGRITDDSGRRASSRLAEIRRRQEFNDTLNAISSQLLFSHGLLPEDDDDYIESQILHEVQQARPRRGRPRRPRPGNLLTTSVTSPPPAPPPPPPRPQMSPEEAEAWQILDHADEENNPLTQAQARARGSSAREVTGTKRQRSMSPQEGAQAGSSSSASVAAKKYKRPSRRSANLPKPTTTHEETNHAPESSSSTSASNPTPVQLLLSTIRSSAVPPPIPTPVLSPSPIVTGRSSLQPVVNGSSSSSPPSPASPSTSISSSPLRPSSPAIYDPRAMAVSALSGSSSVLYSPSSDSKIAGPSWNPRGKQRGTDEVIQPPPTSTESLAAGSPIQSPEKAGSLDGEEAKVPDLPFEQKEKIQGLVRDVLRPLYRGGKITKDEYTAINKRVSRVMYRRVFKDSRKDANASGSGSSSGMGETEGQGKLEHWKTLVERYVNDERRRRRTL